VMVQDVDDRGRDGMTEESCVEVAIRVRVSLRLRLASLLLCSSALLCLSLRRGLRALAWLAGLPLSVCLAFPVSFHHSVLSAMAIGWFP
jgi:hypothetical protein